MKLVWTVSARRDRRSIFDYIHQQNPTSAADMDEAFMQATQQLLKFPLSGRPGRVTNTRELLVHRSYFLVYDMVDGTIRILAIIHTARQWPSE